MKRVLLDHCVPRPLRRYLAGFDVRTCKEEGWTELSNGSLLSTAEAAGFDVIVTADQNLRYQQNLAGRVIAVVELPTNRLSLMPFISQSVAAAISSAAPGSYTVIPLP